MDTIAPVNAVSQQLWLVLAALRLIDEAADAVAAAAAATSALTEDSTWQNRGVSATTLHQALDRLHGEIGGDLLRIGEARDRVEGAIAG